MTHAAVISHPPHPDSDEEWIALGDTGYWSTKDNITNEMTLARAIDALQGVNDTLRLPSDFLAQRRQKFLSDMQVKTAFEEAEEQAQIIFDRLAVPHRLAIVTGPPGAAKTTVAAQWVRLSRLHNAYLPIILITTEKEALQRLQEKMVEAAPDLILTLDEALAGQKPWPKYACVLIDEAGLIDTAAMANLLTQAVTAQAARVLLIGDDKQLLPKGIGQPFRWLREHKKAQVVELSQSFRMKNPRLRQIVSHLYSGHAAAALTELLPSFVLGDHLLSTVRQHLSPLASDKTLVLVHGTANLRDDLRAACPYFRVLTLNEAQGLAFDHAVFVIADKIDLAAMLVGCSRQRHGLDVFIDETIYVDKESLLHDLGAWPKQPMALDIINNQKLV